MKKQPETGEAKVVCIETRQPITASTPKKAKAKRAPNRRKRPASKAASRQPKVERSRMPQKGYRRLLCLEGLLIRMDPCDSVLKDVDTGHHFRQILLYWQDGEPAASFRLWGKPGLISEGGDMLVRAEVFVNHKGDVLEINLDLMKPGKAEPKYRFELDLDHVGHQPAVPGWIQSIAFPGGTGSYMVIDLARAAEAGTVVAGAEESAEARVVAAAA